MVLYPVDVTIDSREANIYIKKQVTIRKYLESLGLKVRVSTLPVGDYLLHARVKEESVLIERKTVTDFANAIRTNRLWEQLELLSLAKKDERMQVVLILEGWIRLLEKFTKWQPQAILRIIETIEVKYGIPVVPSPNFEWTALYIKARATALGRSEEKKVYALRVGRKPKDVQERILYVVEGLVGPVLARRLLKKFKTIKRLANAQKVELMLVEGIGEERAEFIWRVFNTPWEGDVE